jgi:flavodoxin
MDKLVVYYSLFGNTRRIAEAIAEGANRGGDVRVIHFPNPRFETFAFRRKALAFDMDFPGR